ncbi:MAG: DUF4202 domain-containing protein [Acidobacteria bacterium]|nr:DUF4202 domain-containing protein [Acidobacteriota bacterium]
MNAVAVRAIEAIDEANAIDPNVVLVDGKPYPKELLHAERMSDWLERLDPGASDAQRIAARAHHFRRWVLARSEYKSGRAGYLRWRRDQAERQCGEVGELLATVGVSPDIVERVIAIMSKTGLGSDPQVQTHEDALCLVFIELQLDELVGRLDHAAATRTLERTLAKMSSSSHAIALEVASDEGRALIEAALLES